MNRHSVIHDADPHVKYERHSPSRSRANWYLTPLLNCVPVWFRPIIRRTHRAANIFIKDAMRYEALEVAYTASAQYPSRNALERFFHWVWFETANVLAVRNRLRLVKRELKKALIDRLERTGSARMLSIAAGSARAIIEAVYETGNATNQNISLIFLDKDESALAYSQVLLRDFGVTCPVESIHTTLGTYLRNLKGKTEVDIVEMVGLLDYFDDDRAVATFDGIYDILSNHGVYITGNIISHEERPLLSRFAGWHVIYREPEELLRLLVHSKFTKHNILVYVEPFRIHAVSVAGKDHA